MFHYSNKEVPIDTENVYIALTAKGIRSDIHVVARAEKSESEDKLHRAGADRVINPSSIGGRRIAMSILKPVSFDYMDTIFHDGLEEYIVEEIIIADTSRFLNHNLKDNKIREIHGVTVVAIKRNHKIISNPQADEVLISQDMVIVFGTREQLSDFRKSATG